MKVLLRSTILTHHSIGSLRFFGIDIVEHFDGSYSIEQIFDTKRRAMDYLHERVRLYGETNGTEKELRKMHTEINEHGCLSYDAAIACIDKILSDIK